MSTAASVSGYRMFHSTRMILVQRSLLPLHCPKSDPGGSDTRFSSPIPTRTTDPVLAAGAGQNPTLPSPADLRRSRHRRRRIRPEIWPDRAKIDRFLAILDLAPEGQIP